MSRKPALEGRVFFFSGPLSLLRASLVVQLVKNPPVILETWVRSLGWEDSPGEGKGYPLQYSWASLVAQLVRKPPAIAGDLGLIS